MLRDEKDFPLKEKCLVRHYLKLVALYFKHGCTVGWF